MINKLRMLIAVLDFLVKNSAKLTFVPALAGFVTSLQETMAQISAMQEAQLVTSKGHTLTKDALKQKAISSILDIIKRANAYAVVANDLMLKEAISITNSQLEVMPQGNLVSACRLVIDSCSSKIADMAAYGLTAQMLTNAGTDLANYEVALPGAKNIIAARKTATSQLDTLFYDAESTLKKIDAMMEIVSNTDPMFYQNYRNLRVIDDLKGKAKASGSQGITGTVASIDTGLNLAGVKVSITGTSYDAITDADGNYSLSLGETGTFSLKAQLSGYSDYTEDGIEVTAGEFTDLDFDMEQAQ